MEILIIVGLIIVSIVAAAAMASEQVFPHSQEVRFTKKKAIPPKITGGGEIK